MVLLLTQGPSSSKVSLSSPLTEMAAVLVETKPIALVPSVRSKLARLRVKVLALPPARLKTSTPEMTGPVLTDAVGRLLKSIVSVPLPPVTERSAASYTKVLVPLVAVKMSAPAPPSRVLSPVPPLMESSPAPPSK